MSAHLLDHTSHLTPHTSHLTPHILTPQTSPAWPDQSVVEVACWQPSDTWYQVQSCWSVEWWCGGPVMTTTITPPFLTTGWLSINCRKRISISWFPFYFVVVKLFFYFLLHHYYYKWHGGLQLAAAQQTKQWCPLNCDKWNTKNIKSNVSSFPIYIISVQVELSNQIKKVKSRLVGSI